MHVVDSFCSQLTGIIQPSWWPGRSLLSKGSLRWAPRAHQTAGTKRIIRPLPQWGLCQRRSAGLGSLCSLSSQNHHSPWPKAQAMCGVTSEVRYTVPPAAGSVTQSKPQPLRAPVFPSVKWDNDGKLMALLRTAELMEYDVRIHIPLD